METIFFLIFIGVCAFAVVWVSRKSKTSTDLAAKHYPVKEHEPDKLLDTPAGNRLSRRDELWKARCNRAKKGFNTPDKFVPRFETTAEPEYDGYSRRDRHHVTAHEHVKEEAHIENIDELGITSTEFGHKEHASRT